MPLYALSYISDFDLKVSEGLAELLESSTVGFLEKYTLKELSHLLVSVSASKNFMGNESLKTKIEAQIHQKFQSLAETEQ